MSPGRPPRWGTVALLALLLGCLTPATGATASSCSDGGRQRPDEGGIGGTGARPASPEEDDSGIGGTGERPASPDEDDSGIGGTGISMGSDTGLIGTITGFASICVGEVEVHFDSQTPVQVDGRPAASHDLAIGQVVEVVADGAGSELRAREIAVRHVVIGPVTRVDPESNEIAVAGQTVELPARSWESSESAPAPLSAGSWARISGMRRGDGVIVASRVAPADASESVQLTGPVAWSDAGVLRVVGTEVLVDEDANVELGDEVRIVGRWTGTAIQAQSVDVLPRIPFDGRVARVEIEGFPRESTAGQLQVGAFPIQLQPTTAALGELRASNARVRVEGVVGDRQVIVQRFEMLRDLPMRPARPDENARVRRGSDAPDRRHGKPDAPLFSHPGQPPQGGSIMPPPRPGTHGVEVPPRVERPEGRHDVPRAERPERPDPPEPPRPDRPDLPTRPDLPARPDLPTRPDLPDLPNRPQRPDLPDVPRLDRPARPERPPRFERPPSHGRP